MRNKNPQLLILIGAPGSGKSTFAKYHIRTNLNWVRVCRDDMRLMQFSQSFLSDEMEGLITDMIYASTEQLLTKKVNVITDATHTKADFLNQYIHRFGHLADISFKLFETDKKELALRCTQREKETGKFIPEKAINHHVNALEELKKEFDFSTRPRAKFINEIRLQDASLPKAIICDLDGTLALMDDRNPFDASNCEQDRLNEAVAVSLNAYVKDGFKILLVSGREDKYKPQTENFLKKYQILYDGLWMRPEGNYQKDSIIKKRIFETEIQDKYYVSLVLDDRDQVVEMWRNDLKLPCFQVFYGAF
ncbi:phosphatase domain-containing protein [Rhizosphaericola mali]|uniref:AAA family ATPase n=1 Tax=Rhizosphaericola mali TaxID=2545455 RepID=A0A5P2G8T0_9BACT|nr:AAA family ATPase [Rhizosphaericola mali]QES90709.1 AAA family ATPase [Rhizosphaericola mali]